MTARVPTTKRQVLTLLMTERCNLRCTYCYESKDRRGRLSSVTAKSAILEAFGRPGFDELEIDFFGGEPMLEFERIRDICEWLWSEPRTKPHVCFATTNGTLVHGEVQEWAFRNRERILLGLSLDGTPEMHNRNRSNSYSKIDLDFFRRAWPQQPVKMTVSRETLGAMAEGVIYIHEAGFMVLCTYAFGTEWQQRDTGVFERELKKLVDYYLAHPEIEPSNVVTMAVAYSGSAAPPKNYCGTGKAMSVVNVDGKRYPCQTFLPVSTGKTLDDMKHVFARLQDEEHNGTGRCKDCCLLAICQTCYGMNYIQYGDPFARGELNCTFSKIRARASAYMLAEMIAHRHRGYVYLNGKTDTDIFYMISGIMAVREAVGL